MQVTHGSNSGFVGEGVYWSECKICGWTHTECGVVEEWMIQ
jgi:hypothetical protein